MGDVSQLSKVFVCFGSEEGVSGKRLRLIFNDLFSNGFAAGAHQSEGFNCRHRLVAEPTMVTSAPALQRGNRIAMLSPPYNFSLRN